MGLILSHCWLKSCSERALLTTTEKGEACPDVHTVCQLEELSMQPKDELDAFHVYVQMIRRSPPYI